MDDSRHRIGHDLRAIAALVPWSVGDEALGGPENDNPCHRTLGPVISVGCPSSFVRPFLCDPLGELDEALLRAPAHNVRELREAVLNFSKIGLRDYLGPWIETEELLLLLWREAGLVVEVLATGTLVIPVSLHLGVTD